MGSIQKRTQHPFGIGRSEGADVGIKQSDHFGVLAGDPKPLPNSPAFPRWARYIKAQFANRFQELTNGRPIGPVNLHWKGHVGKEPLGGNHVVRMAGGQRDHE